ncbi:hypothetical protein LguiB_021073 [Lonicera macranthoides]
MEGSHQTVSTATRSSTKLKPSAFMRRCALRAQCSNEEGCKEGRQHTQKEIKK